MATAPAPAAAAAAPAAAAGQAKRPEEQLRELLRGGWRRIDLRLVNMFLVALIVVLAVFLGGEVIATASRLSAMSAKGYSLAGLIQPAGGFKEIAAMRGLSYYSEKVVSRNIFKRGGKIDEEKKADQSPSAKALELVQALRLVGISWSDSPDAMVENTKSGQTFFIKKGQSVGELQVEDIQKDRLILRYNRELVELK